MSETQSVAIASPTAVHSKLNKSPGAIGMILFAVVLIGGFAYAGFNLASDLSGSGHFDTIWPYVLLGVALLTALGFEFVNGFHDTANAVATVIYTHAMEPHIAVVWSGMWNLIGVLTSSGAVAFTIISLLPVELILQVGHGAGFAMVFALLIAAILWNLGTWWLGLPASSSHTLIGSIIGVGLANQLMSPKGSGTSGVDWAQAGGVLRALLLSPVFGFVLAGGLLLLLKNLVKIPALFKAPEGDAPPPFWIRGLLILTCTGVSFAHGSNDGQKGMGLIMLILIGTVPTVVRAQPRRRTSTRCRTSLAVSRARQPTTMDSYLQQNGCRRLRIRVRTLSAMYVRTQYISQQEADAMNTLAAERVLMTDVQNSRSRSHQ